MGMLGSVTGEVLRLFFVFRPVRRKWESRNLRPKLAEQAGYVRNNHHRQARSLRQEVQSFSMVNAPSTSVLKGN